MKLKVKICCISSTKEAEIAIAAGTDCIGLVGAMPSGPGIIADDLIAKIAATVPKPIETFLLTSQTDAPAIIAHHEQAKTTTIQLVDKMEASSYQLLRKALPDVKLVQVIHVLDESSINEALDISSKVDYLLLDSGNPNLKVKELGGTGRVHNWTISREIVELVEIPVFLAGGLTAGNVVEAIQEVEPYGVDLCSGVRTNGQLDSQKLKDFMTQVRSA